MERLKRGNAINVLFGFNSHLDIAWNGVMRGNRKGTWRGPVDPWWCYAP